MPLKFSTFNSKELEMLAKGVCPYDLFIAEKDKLMAKLKVNIFLTKLIQKQRKYTDF